MGFLTPDVEIRKIVWSAHAIESLNAHHRPPCGPENASRANAALKCLGVVTRTLYDRTPPGTVGHRPYKICTEINADDSRWVLFAAACVKNR